MKQNFKIKVGYALALGALLTPKMTFAQGVIDIGETINQQGNSIVKGFGVIALVGLVIVFIYSAKEFTKDNGDSKKAWVAIIAYLIAVGIVIAVAANLRSINL